MKEKVYTFEIFYLRCRQPCNKFTKVGRKQPNKSFPCEGEVPSEREAEEVGTVEPQRSISRVSRFVPFA